MFLQDKCNPNLESCCQLRIEMILHVPGDDGLIVDPLQRLLPVFDSFCILLFSRSNLTGEVLTFKIRSGPPAQFRLNVTGNYCYQLEGKFLEWVEP